MNKTTSKQVTTVKKLSEFKPYDIFRYYGLKTEWTVMRQDGETTFVNRLDRNGDSILPEDKPEKSDKVVVVVYLSLDRSINQQPEN